MKRFAPLAFPLLAVALLAGCQGQQLARDLVTPAGSRSTGQWFDLTPTGSRMVERGRIDAHRSIDGDGGVEIDTWVIKARPAKGAEPAGKTIVVLHGLNETKAEYPYMGIGERLAKKGYDVVLPDLRGHGRSGGQYLTYGVREKHDLKAVADALIDEKLISPDIYVFGANYGGTVAIQYAAFDERVAGVTAVTPYRDFPSMATIWLQMRLQSPEKIKEAVAEAGQIAAFVPAEASAVEAARNFDGPILLIHGLLDPAAPLAHSQAIRDAAAGPKKLIVPTVDQVVLVTILEDWIADRVDSVAQGQIKQVTPGKD